VKKTQEPQGIIFAGFAMSQERIRGHRQGKGGGGRVEVQVRSSHFGGGPQDPAKSRSWAAWEGRRQEKSYAKKKTQNATK